MTETTEEKAFFITEKTPLKSRIEELEKLVTSLTKERDELKEKIEPNEYYCTACRDCNWEGSSKFLRVSQFDECDITCPCCHSKNLVDTNIELNDNQSISNLHEYIDMQEFRISSIKSTSRVIANHNAHLKSQLSNRDKEIEELKETVKPAIDCLEALLFAAGEGGANDLEFEFIVDTAIEYGCITKIKLDADIGPDDEEVLCMRLPNMEALASLQSKQGEE